MTARAQIIELMNDVPETDMPILLEVVRRFVSFDDVATPEDIAAHEQAMKEFAAGETIPYDAINWDA